MSLELFSLFSTERQSCCAAWTMLCFPSSGDNIFTVGLQDTTETHTSTHREVKETVNISFFKYSHNISVHFTIYHPKSCMANANTKSVVWNSISCPEPDQGCWLFGTSPQKTVGIRVKCQHFLCFNGKIEWQKNGGDRSP